MTLTLFFARLHGPHCDLLRLYMSCLCLPHGVPGALRASTSSATTTPCPTSPGQAPEAPRRAGAPVAHTRDGSLRSQTSQRIPADHQRPSVSSFRSLPVRRFVLFATQSVADQVQLSSERLRSIVERLAKRSVQVLQDSLSSSIAAIGSSEIASSIARHLAATVRKRYRPYHDNTVTSRGVPRV